MIQQFNYLYRWKFFDENELKARQMEHGMQTRLNNLHAAGYEQKKPNQLLR